MRSPQLRLSTLQRDPFRVLSRLQRKQGDIACFWLGRQRGYYVAAPELVDELFVRHRDDLGKRSSITRWWLRRPPTFVRGELFFTHDEGDHARIRKHFNRTFSSHHARQDAGRSASIIERIYREAAGREIEMMHLAELLVVTAGMTTLLDREPDAATASEIVDLAGSARETSAVFSSKSQLRRRRLLHPRRTRKIREAHSALAEICESFLLAHPDERPTALSARMRLLRDLSSPSVMLMISSLAPLIDSTAPAIVYALIAAASDPSIATQLTGEVDALGAALLDGESLERLPLSCAAADESLRLCTTWHVGRLCQRPFTAAGREFRVGDWLLTSPALIQRDERFWPEPEEFRLDRWTPEQAASRPKYAYMPFGFGNRICVGRNLTQTTIALALAIFFRDWQLELKAAPPAWRAVQTGDFAPSKPVYTRLVPRKAAGALRFDGAAGTRHKNRGT